MIYLRGTADGFCKQLFAMPDYRASGAIRKGLARCALQSWMLAMDLLV
jgi:hypothetical protein